MSAVDGNSIATSSVESRLVTLSAALVLGYSVDVDAGVSSVVVGERELQSSREIETMVDAGRGKTVRITLVERNVEVPSVTKISRRQSYVTCSSFGYTTFLYNGTQEPLDLWTNNHSVKPSKSLFYLSPNESVVYVETFIPASPGCFLITSVEHNIGEVLIGTPWKRR